MTHEHSMKRARWQRIIWLVSAGLLAGATGVSFAALAERSARRATTPAAPLVVATQPAALLAGYTVRRAYTGRLEARRSSDVGFERSGKVIEIAADDGDVVAAGQTLAWLDIERLEATRAEAHAAEREAEARADLARATHRRVADAFERSAASAQELDDAEDLRDASIAALDRARRAVETIDIDIEKSVLLAPYDAIVARRFVDDGQVIAAGAPVFELLERQSPEARIGVPPEVAEALRSGDTLTVRIRDEELTGVLTDLLPVTSSGTRSVEVIVALDTVIDGARHGDLVSIAFERHIEAAGFWLPLSALTESTRGLWACLVAAPLESDDGHRIERRHLEVLHTDGQQAFVTGTLEDGDLVLAAGVHRVVPGDNVTPADGGSP